MGLWESKEEEKMIDTNGQVNNNIVIQEAADIHDQAKTSERILFVMYFTCILEIIKIGIFIYSCFIKKMKKKYGNSTKA